MRRGVLVTGLALVLSAAGGAALAADVYDGDWDVALHCPTDPHGAMEFSYQFTVQVKDSELRGDYGDPGQPGWMRLHGEIKPDGGAHLAADGITGEPAYNVGGAGRGIAYTHPVTAQFTGAHGDGSWVTTRTCSFTFDKR